MTNPVATPKKIRICFCHGVDEEELRRVIRAGAHTIEAIQKETLASTGCGGCFPEVDQILKEELEKLKQKG